MCSMGTHRGGHVSRTRRGARFRAAYRIPIVRVCIVVVVILLGEAVLTSALPVKDRDVMLAVLAASALTSSAWLTIGLARSHRRSLSRLGEEATARAVACARQRRKGWRIVDSSYLRDHGVVDHVLVGPGGVYVIESRWASKKCEIGRTAIAGIHGRNPLSTARGSASRVEVLLGDSPGRIAVTVKPVVVVWGPGGPRLDAGWATVAGVLVCEGRQEEQWLNHLDGTVLSQRTVELVTDQLMGLLTHHIDQPASIPCC